MAVFTRFSGGFCIRRVCVAPAALPPLWAVPGPPGHEKRTPTAADAHDLKIVVKLRAVPASKVPFPVEIAGFPDFSRPVPVYPAFLKYVVPVQFALLKTQIGVMIGCGTFQIGSRPMGGRKRRTQTGRNLFKRPGAMKTETKELAGNAALKSFYSIVFPGLTSPRWRRAPGRRGSDA